MGKRKWYINQCDYCRFFSERKFCDAGPGYVLNMNQETTKKCKDFEEVLKYNKQDVYNKLLYKHYQKEGFTKPEIKNKMKFIKEEDREQKCIELDLITNVDYEILNNIGKRDTSMLDEENLRESEEYLLWKKEVFKRDNHTCQICGKKGLVHAHHLESFSKYPELRYDINNGITLCAKHHDIKYTGSFHNIYGTRNFTKDDFFIYKNNQIRGL